MGTGGLLPGSKATGP